MPSLPSKTPDFTKGDPRRVGLRKRHYRGFIQAGSWPKYGDVLGINRGVIWEFVMNGKEPAALNLRRALGLKVICKWCGRPFRRPSPQARQVHASPAQRWWWSLSPAKRAKLMERNYKERK